MGSHIHYFISALVLVHTAVSTAPRVLYPLSRRHWNGPEHQLPSWFHRNGHPNGNYWGENDCDKNRTTPQVDFELQGDEQLVWGSPNDTNAVVASVIIAPYPDQRIIDMGRFSEGIVRSMCSESNILLQFDSVGTFDKAQASWNWVNEDTQKVFILVADPNLCNSGLDRDPWSVTHATFNPATREVRLNATKKRWAEVIYDYKIDFGAAEATTMQKRTSILDYAYNNAFEIPLTRTFGPNLFDFKFNDPTDNALAVQFGVKCNDCGLFGRLKFVGRIEGNYILGVTKFDLGLTPEGVHAVLNLELLFSGRYELGMYGLPDMKEVFPSPDIPLLYSWKIDGIIELGPKIRLQTGFELESIKGKARLTTGLTATVPDDSIARLSFRSDDVFQVNGWTPTFEVQPVDLDAQISAVVQLYFQVVPAFDFVILRQRGLRAGIPINLPNVEVNITAGEDPNGFCPGNPSPYGVKIQTKVGVKVAAVAVIERAALGLNQLFGNAHNKVDLVKAEVVEEIPVNKVPLEEVFEEAAKVVPKSNVARSIQTRDINLQEGEITIIDKEVLNLPTYEFDPWCRALPGQPCPPFTPELDDQEWYDSEINSAIEDDSDSLKKRTSLSPRNGDGSRTFECNGVSTEYKVKNYPGPSLWKTRFQNGRDSKISIATPGIKRCQESCPVDNWTVTSLAKPDVVEIVETDKNKRRTDWSVDHVYEVGWLAKFWEYLAVKRGLICPNAKSNIDAKLLHIGTQGGYADEMLSRVGTLKTYLDMMILFPTDLNSLKHRMFAGKKLYTKSAAKSQAAKKRACSIGRIVTVCKYMAMSQTQSRLKNTLEALNELFAKMDADCDIPHPDGTYISAHREWFTDLYNQGMRKTRETLTEYAQLMQLKENLADFDNLDGKTKESIIRISELNPEGDWEEFCPNPFKYPDSNSMHDNLKGDPANCGYCGNKCSADQKCNGGQCIASSTPDTPLPGTFPPTVTPNDGIITDWAVVFYDPPFTNTGSYILPKENFVEVGGKLTLNTKCLVVSEIESSQDSTFFTNAKFSWHRSSEGVEDSCCLAVFPGTSCTPSERKEFCFNSEDYQMPFDAQSMMVFGCHGLKIDH